MKARVYKDTTGRGWAARQPWVCDMRHPRAGMIRHTTWEAAMRDAEVTGSALRRQDETYRQ